MTTQAQPRPDPIPALLLLLTVTSGVVDAISFLRFDHVFVANMTGNVVFLGFAAAGEAHLSIAGSLVALASFLVGSFFAGRLAARLRERKARLLAECIVAEAILVAVAFAVALVSGDPLPAASQYAMIVALALAMGAQNAVAQVLAVPDLTTSVLTRTLTGMAADILDDIERGRLTPRLVRRITAVLAMLLGAFAGAALVLHVGTAAGAALALVLLAITAAGAVRHARAEAGQPAA